MSIVQTRSVQYFAALLHNAHHLVYQERHTPLWVAIENNHVGVVEMLLEAGADVAKVLSTYTEE